MPLPTQSRDGSKKANSKQPWDHGIHPRTHGYLSQLSPAAVRAKLADAQEQLAYWTAAKFSSAIHQDRLAAGARIHLWQMQVDSCTRRLREIARTQALTA